MKHIYLILSILLSYFSLPADATTYYISTSGSDANSGTSPNQAWATITKVNSINFLPGDNILFEGSTTFAGGLDFNSNDKGTATKPILIGSYGVGRATINSENTGGLNIYNTSGFKVKNLIFKGAGRTLNKKNGILFYMDIPTARLDYVFIDSVEVYGYYNAGIAIGSWSNVSGFDNISITNATVHDNGEAGITSWSEAPFAHKNIYVGYNKVYNNSGLPERTQSHSGNGIVIGGADGALIEYCESYNNGWLNACPTGGPVGIWGHTSNNLVIQYNEAHHNRTGTTKDGGGFDIDGGCTNSIVQYNYSHDNDGPGYLIVQYEGAPVLQGITIRYNISENDSRRNGHGGIHLWSSGSNGGIQNAEIYNNTVYMTPASNGSPKALYVESNGMKNIKFWNNILQTTGGLEVVRVQPNAELRFEGNCYWSSGSSFKINWAGTTYSSLEAWRQATTQETLGGTATGYLANPELNTPGAGGTLSNPKELNKLNAYKLKETSSLVKAGLNLTDKFGINAGRTDFWGNSISQLANVSVGAHQLTLKATQRINFAALPNKTFGDAPFFINATSTSGLAVNLGVVSGPATISDNTITITGTGTVTLEATQNGNDNYALAPSVTQTFPVSKANQFIKFLDITTKTYGDEPFSLQATASSGLPVRFEVISGPATINGNTVTLLEPGVVNISALQDGDTNYLAAPTLNYSFTVNPAPKKEQIITFTPLTDQTYGAAPISLTATTNSGLPVSFQVISDVATLSGNILNLNGAGMVTIIASQTGNEAFNAALSVEQSFNIKQATQSISFAPLSNKVFGSAPFTVSATASSGLPVSFSILSGPATITNNLITITGAGTVIVRGEQIGNTNYLAATPIDHSFTVNPMSQVISFAALPDKILGSAPFNLVATASSGLPVSFSIIAGPATINGNTVTFTATGTVTVRATQAGNTNYQAAFLDRSFTVQALAKQNQTISFAAIASQNFGVAPLTLSATASSGLPVILHLISGPGTLTGNTLTLTGAGTITVEALQTGNDTYLAAIPVQQSFIVEPAAQTINFASLSNQTYGNAPFNLSATASSGLPVSFTVVSGPATIAQQMLTITRAGTVVVAATQVGNTNFKAANAITHSFIVDKASQSIRFDNIADKLVSDAPFSLIANASSGLPVSFSILSGTANLSGNVLTLTGSGTVTVRASQTGNNNYLVASSVDRTFNVQAITAPVCTATGTILRERWNNIKGNSVANIPLLTTPSSTNQLTMFETSRELDPSYGARMRGYLCVPQNGNYTFYVAGDDDVELWLSSNDDPENKIRIAYTHSKTAPRQWYKFSSQKSAPISLVVGKRYYIEALHKDAGGDNYMAVAWQLPDGTMEGPISGTRLSPYETSEVDTNPNPITPNESISNPAKTNNYSVYPNPFSSTTTVQFTLVETAETTVEILDLNGLVRQTIYTGPAKANKKYSFEFDGSKFSSGIYICRIKYGKKLLIKPLMLIK